MSFWVLAWLRAFALTLAVELPVAVALLAFIEPRRARRAGAAVLANLATHPLVWFAFPGLTAGPAARLASSEVWAVVGEAAIYRFIWPALPLHRAALVSLAANTASFLVGLALARLGLVH